MKIATSLIRQPNHKMATINLILSAIRIFKSSGLRGLVRGAKLELNSRLALRVDSARALRREVGLAVYGKTNGVVAQGLFKGMKYSLPKNSWSDGDLVSYLLGIYELEVQNALVAHSRNRGTFIDIGAGTGYFAVGALTSGLFSKALCFELDSTNRHEILKNARLNGVESSIEVRGEFTAKSAFSPGEVEDAVCLIDIEGAEFELLSEQVVASLCNTILIIEIHNWTVSQHRISALESLINVTHEISTIESGPRDPHHELLGDYVEDVRWLLVSEGRQSRGLWWVCSPRANS